MAVIGNREDTVTIMQGVLSCQPESHIRSCHPSFSYLLFFRYSKRKKAFLDRSMSLIPLFFQYCKEKKSFLDLSMPTPPLYILILQEEKRIYVEELKKSSNEKSAFLDLRCPPSFHPSFPPLFFEYCKVRKRFLISLCFSSLLPSLFFLTLSMPIPTCHLTFPPLFFLYRLGG